MPFFKRQPPKQTARKKTTAARLKRVPVTKLKFKKQVRTPKSPVRICFACFGGLRSGTAARIFLKLLKKKNISEFFEIIIAGVSPKSGVLLDSKFKRLPFEKGRNFQAKIAGNDLIVLPFGEAEYYPQDYRFIPKPKLFSFNWAVEGNAEAQRLLLEVLKRFRLVEK